MKYFFTRKEEFSRPLGEDIQGLKGLFLIYTEENLKEIIQAGHIDKFNRIDPFEEGSVVRLPPKRPVGWDRNGDMDHMLNEEVTVESFDEKWLYIEECSEYNYRSSNVYEVIQY